MDGANIHIIIQICGNSELTPLVQSNESKTTVPYHFMKSLKAKHTRFYPTTPGNLVSFLGPGGGLDLL